MITDEQVAQYFREGYLILESLVPQQNIDPVLGALPDHPGFGGQWGAFVFDHDQPLEASGLHQLLVEPHIVEVVEKIFGVPARVYYGMLAVVEPDGYGLPWHQDNQYSQILGHALNVFVALGRITPAMGGLWVDPESHLQGLLPSQAAGEETHAPGHRQSLIDPDEPRQLPAMNPGDACIFDRYMLHRSGQNLSSMARYAYAAQYMADNARMAATGERDARRMLATDLRKQWETREVVTA